MNTLILGPQQRNQNIIDFLKKKSITVFRTEDTLTTEYLEEHQIDWMISNGYAPIIKEPIISLYHNRIINIHPAYVPQGRGIFPNVWSFFEGFPKGVTLHFINTGIDTGDIIVRDEISITDSDTLQTSNQKLLDRAETLFFENWDDIITEKKTPLKQSTQIGINSYYRRIDGEALMEYLPERWNTPVKTVEKMGSDFLLSVDFWTSYHQEIKTSE